MTPSDGLRPLRILFLADVEPDQNSGAAGTEMRLAQELTALGHTVVCAWRDQLSHRISHWNLHHLLEQPRAYLDVAERLAEEAAFDVLHVNQPAGWRLARQVRRSGGAALFVHRSHGFEPRIAAEIERWKKIFPDTSRRPLLRRLGSTVLAPLLVRQSWAIIRWADAHVVSCRECENYLVSCGVGPQDVHLSPQAAPDHFLDRPVLPLDEGRLDRLLMVGQAAYFKAPMVAARVVSELLRRRPTMEVTWVSDAGSHGDLRGMLQNGLGTRVQFLPWMDQEELQTVFDRHGIFLFPSFAEGFGKVFLEAMARGLCVVATAQGGARDVIEPGVNGFLADVGDVNGLVARIEESLSDVVRAARISARAREDARRLTWRGAAERLARFYEERLAAKQGAC